MCRRSACPTRAQRDEQCSTTRSLPEYVSDQLQAFREWGGGGEFANFADGLGPDPAQYEDYRSATEAASTPGTVDESDPTVEIADAGLRPVITGTATDNLGIKAVRWQDDQGDLGRRSCSGRSSPATTTPGIEWQMRWLDAVDELESGRVGGQNVTAEDIKGRTSAPIVHPL